MELVLLENDHAAFYLAVNILITDKMKNISKFIEDRKLLN